MPQTLEQLAMDDATAKLQKLLILCIGGKGGIGKTLICRLLFHFYVSEGISALGFDADRENPEFYDYHQQAEYTVETLNFLSVPGMRSLMERLDLDSPPVALVDMPGASGSATREQVTRFDFFNTLNYEVGGYRVTILAVLNNCFNSIGSLTSTMDAFGEQANYVVILNQMWAVGEEPFNRWYRSPNRQKFLDLGGIEIELPLLDLEVFDLLHGLAIPFWHQDELGIADRVLLRSFLNRARVAFDPAAALLGLSPLQLSDPFNSISSAQAETPRGGAVEAKTEPQAKAKTKAKTESKVKTTKQGPAKASKSNNVDTKSAAATTTAEPVSKLDKHVVATNTSVADVAPGGTSL